MAGPQTAGTLFVDGFHILRNHGVSKVPLVLESIGFLGERSGLHWRLFHPDGSDITALDAECEIYSDVCFKRDKPPSTEQRKHIGYLLHMLRSFGEEAEVLVGVLVALEEDVGRKDITLIDLLFVMEAMFMQFFMFCDFGFTRYCGGLRRKSVQKIKSFDTAYLVDMTNPPVDLNKFKKISLALETRSKDATKVLCTLANTVAACVAEEDHAITFVLELYTKHMSVRGSVVRLCNDKGVPSWGILFPVDVNKSLQPTWVFVRNILHFYVVFQHIKSYGRTIKRKELMSYLEGGDMYAENPPTRCLGLYAGLVMTPAIDADGVVRDFSRPVYVRSLEVGTMYPHLEFSELLNKEVPDTRGKRQRVVEHTSRKKKKRESSARREREVEPEDPAPAQPEEPPAEQPPGDTVAAAERKEEPLPEAACDGQPEEPMVEAVCEQPEEPMVEAACEQPEEPMMEAACEQPEEPMEEAACDVQPEEPLQDVACDVQPEEPVSEVVCDDQPEEPVPEAVCGDQPEEPVPEAACDDQPEEPMPEVACDDQPEEPMPEAACDDQPEEPVPAPDAHSEHQEEPTAEDAPSDLSEESQAADDMIICDGPGVCSPQAGACPSPATSEVRFLAGAPAIDIKELDARSLRISWSSNLPLSPNTRAIFDEMDEWSFDEFRSEVVQGGGAPWLREEAMDHVPLGAPAMDQSMSQLYLQALDANVFEPKTASTMLEGAPLTGTSPLLQVFSPAYVATPAPALSPGAPPVDTVPLPYVQMSEAGPRLFATPATINAIGRSLPQWWPTSL